MSSPELLLPGPMSGLKLIVNADDFGLSEEINDGIIQSYEDGIVTCTSLIPSGRATEHAIEHIQQNPAVDVGVHLTLVAEPPMLDTQAIPSLIGEKGRLHASAQAFAARYLQNRIDYSEVRAELDAQIRFVLAAGIRVTHLDSHQHVHVLPKIMQIVIDLASQHKIPAVRLPREKLKPYMLKDVRRYRRITEMIFLSVLSERAKCRDILATNHFAGFFYGGNLSRDNIKTVIANLPTSGVCELMCHPASPRAGSYHQHWGYRGDEELEAVTHSEVFELLQQRNIELLSFGEFIECRS